MAAQTYVWDHQSRAPQGARGLKLTDWGSRGREFKSRPARGAWIEIASMSQVGTITIVAPRMGRVA